MISIVDKLKSFILNSNAIEGYVGAAYQPGSIYYDQHLEAFEYLCESDITEKDILIAHSILMKDLLERYRGMYRLTNVHINLLDGGVHRFPAATYIPNMMSVWESTLHMCTTNVHCWQAHALFENIHPFIDGNGRIGRCIWNAMRLRNGLDLIVIYNKNKRNYYNALTNFRKKNNVKNINRL